MRALLRDQRHQLAHVGVVDRVVDRVGHRGVGPADVEPQVHDQALAHLALGVGDAVVGVQGQAGDLDRDRFGGVLTFLIQAVTLVV